MRHDPINIGSSKQGSILQDDVEIEELITNRRDGADAGAVFNTDRLLET